MEFKEELLHNRALTEQTLAFDLPLDVQEKRLGASVQPDGSIALRVAAPGGAHVLVRYMKTERTLTETEPGIYTGEIAYSRPLAGPVPLELSVNGNPVLDPLLPMDWTMNRPCNYVELPDPENAFLLLRDVPHGAVRRELFFSQVMDGWERCMVYTPPGYGADGRTYPVLYLLHGTGDNELSWEYMGKLPYILDNLLAAGEAEPFLVVMCNGMLRSGGQVERFLDGAFETMLTQECLPFIEKAYRVKTGKWNRGIAGLSMGAYTTNDIVWHQPETFGWVGQFTASMVREPVWTSYRRPFADALKQMDREKFSELFRLFFRSTTPQEDHMEFFAADDAIYHFYGLDSAPCYKRTVYGDDVSKWTSWRMGLRDFARLVFQSGM